nr:MAG TPA: hypothetical protein [Caudoviricetes sp.]
MMAALGAIRGLFRIRSVYIFLTTRKLVEKLLTF